MISEQNTFLTNAAHKRLLKDVIEIIKEPLTEHGIYYVHDDENIRNGLALIFGPEDSLYENGIYLFKFDFPTDYPYKPPILTYLTNDGETRFHPNLYRNGKVCLSILNTWKGEQWTSCQNIKTVLLTLVTLFHNKPLLCEPGFSERSSDFIPYNNIIQYKNFEISIKRIINKSVIPDDFLIFFPFIKKHIIQQRDNILKKINQLSKSKLNKSKQHVRVYNMTFILDYDKLETDLSLAIKNLLKIEIKNI